MLFLIEWHLYGPGVKQPSEEEMNWETSDLNSVPSEVASRLCRVIGRRWGDWPYDEPAISMDIRITRVERSQNVWPLFGDLGLDEEDVVIWPEGRWTIAPEGGQP